MRKDVIRKRIRKDRYKRRKKPEIITLRPRRVGYYTVTNVKGLRKGEAMPKDREKSKEHKPEKPAEKPPEPEPKPETVPIKPRIVEKMLKDEGIKTLSH